MTFRNDDDARLARTDALQRDLDDTQEELAETKRKLAAAKAEKQQLLDARIPQPEPASSMPAQSPAPTSNDDPESGSLGAGGVVVCVLLLALLVILGAVLRHERCAVVYSELGRVRWVKKSPSFTAWSPKGRAAEPASAAFDYFDGGALDQSSRVVPAATWLPREAEHGELPMYEHATALPGAGTVFSLLWMPHVA